MCTGQSQGWGRKALWPSVGGKARAQADTSVPSEPQLLALGLQWIWHVLEVNSDHMEMYPTFPWKAPTSCFILYLSSKLDESLNMV